MWNLIFVSSPPACDMFEYKNDGKCRFMPHIRLKGKTSPHPVIRHLIIGMLRTYSAHLKLALSQNIQSLLVFAVSDV